MTKISIENAASSLPNLVKEAKRGEEVLLTEDDHPVIRLVPVEPPEPGHKPGPAQARFGSGRGLILYMSPDFDAPLEDFEDYMP